MKRKKSLIVLLIVLAVIVALVIIVNLVQKHQDKIKAAGETVVEYDLDDVSHIEWTYGSKISNAFTKKDDVWYCDADEAMPVDEDALEDIIDSLSSYNSAFVIDEPQNLSDYDLKSPTCTVAITFSGDSAENYEGYATENEDGSKTVTVNFGGYSSMDEERYFSVGDGKVYLAVTDEMSTFNVETSEFVKMDTLPDFGTVVSLDLSGANTLSLYYFADSDKSYSEYVKYFLKEDGEYIGVDTDYANALVNVITGMYLGSYKSYTADTDDLSVYGLDEPSLTATLIYEDDDSEQQSFVMYFGEKSDNVYVRMDGSNFVFLIDSADYEDLTEANLETLRSERLEEIYWNNVTKITAVIGSDAWDIEVSCSNKGVFTYTFNDEEVDASDITDTLDSVKIAEFNNSLTMGKKEVSLTIYQDNENYPQLTVDLYRIDGEYCAAYFMGECIGTVSREKVVSLIEYIYDITL